jgi:molybdopterin-guanine dinucleotide biosynthesis protein A
MNYNHPNSENSVGVLILAGGGEKDRALAVSEGAAHTSLLMIGGRTVLAGMLGAFEQTPEVKEIVVVGTPAVRAALPPGVISVEAQGEAGNNLRLGLAAAREEWLMVSPADIPFLTPQIIRDFLREAFATGAELIYPIVRRQDYEQRFPEGKRTYVSLREGTFTGGNIVLVKRNLLQQLLPLIQDLFRNRKNPLGLAGILGFGFILKLLFRLLDLSAIEKRASQLVAGKAVALPTRQAELALDIDKREDLQAARQFNQS